MTTKKTNKKATIKRRKKQEICLMRLSGILLIFLINLLSVTVAVMIIGNKGIQKVEKEFNVDVQIEENTERVPVKTQFFMYIHSLPMPEIPVQEEYVMTEEELFALCTAYGEAVGEGIYGQKLVLETIRNRTEHYEFPDTLKAVCTDDGQFLAVQNGVPMLGDQPVTPENITEEMTETLSEVLAGSDETERLLKEVAEQKGVTDPKYWEGGAVYFSNFDAIEDLSSYEKIQVCVKVGNHTFWRYWDN